MVAVRSPALHALCVGVAICGLSLASGAGASAAVDRRLVAADVPHVLHGAVRALGTLQPRKAISDDYAWHVWVLTFQCEHHCSSLVVLRGCSGPSESLNKALKILFLQQHRRRIFRTRLSDKGRESAGALL